MKKSSIGCVVAALALAAINIPASSFAQLGDDPIVTDLLYSGDWILKGKGWSDTWTFNRDHTVTQHENPPKETLTWSITGNEIAIKHADYYDYISLPLDPNGTAARSTKWGGYKFTVLRSGSASTQSSRTAGGATGSGTNAFGSSGINALKPLATPAPAGAAAPPKDKNAETTALLTAKTWLFTGSNWTQHRKFNADGTITVDNNKSLAPRNHWAIDGDQVVMTFPSGKDVLSLPLDPNGTKGQDGYGFDVTAIQVQDDTATDSGGGKSVFGSSAAPQ